MNNTTTPFLERDKRKKHLKKRKKKRLIFNVSIVFAIIILMCVTYLILFGYNTSLSIKIFGEAFAEYSPSPSSESIAIEVVTPEITASPILETPSPTVAPTSTPFEPTPIPYIHPGIRDDKFTDGEVITDDMSYHSDELSIEIEKVERDESVLYVAEVYFKSLENFIPVFANGRFDNGYQTTYEMAEDNKAIFAINSDSATATDYGIIVRDKEIYRDILAADHLAVFQDGSIQTYMPMNISAESLIKKDAEHVFCFGPRLLDDGNVIDNFRYSHIRSKHPRTAIGMIEPYHYYIVVVDGRSSYSKGMTLEQLSKYVKELGCSVAYNLDGGGSSTMIFKGKLINKPEGDTTQRAIDSAIIFKDSYPVDFYPSEESEE